MGTTVWSSLRLLLWRHLETTVSLGYYKGFSADLSPLARFPWPNFLINGVLQKVSIMFLIGRFLIGGLIL